MSTIQRFQPTSDETPPWAGISFTHRVASDALYEHLKNKYPQYATLRERKHIATIDFLKAELRQMQSNNQLLGAPEDLNEYQAPASPESPSSSSEVAEGWSRGGSASVLESPASQFSVSADHGLQQNSPAALAQVQPVTLPIANSGQYAVFSAKDGRMMQPKSRKRKMTAEERTNYKQTRKRGACTKCKKLKGRCTHTIGMAKESRGAEEMDILPKRLSQEPGSDHRDRNKTLQFDGTTNSHPLTSNFPHPQDTKSFITSPALNNDGVVVSTDQHGVTPSDTQWDEGSREGVHIATHGYVPHSRSNVFTHPLSDNHQVSWGHYGATPTAGHSSVPAQTGFGEASTQPGTTYPMAPPESEPSSEYFNYYVEGSWTPREDPLSKDTNPG